MSAIDDAVKELKQNNPLGGIDPNALARNAKIILALISKTLLYNIECFATTNCNNARIIPSKNAIGVSIQRAPNANASKFSHRYNNNDVRPTQTEAKPYMRTTTQRRYSGGFLTISSRSFAASSTFTTSWSTPWS